MKKQLTLGIIILILGCYFPHLPTQAQDNLRIVIMPFNNITQKNDDSWIGESFSESLTMALAQLKSLEVIERSQLKLILKEQAFGQSAMVDDATAPQLGKILGANMVLVGSFVKVSDQLMIHARFVDVETGKVDADKLAQISGSITDIFDMQKQLANQLTKRLQVSQSNKEWSELERLLFATQSVSAYEHYIKGLETLQYLTDEKFAETIKHFQQALKQDSEYALVYVALAEAYQLRSSVKELLVESDSNDIDKALEYAQKAIQLDPHLADAHRALASVYQEKGNITAAKKAIRQALLLNSKSLDNILKYIEIQYHDKLDFKNIQADLRSFHVDFQEPWVQFRIGQIYFDRWRQNPEVDISLVLPLLENARQQLPQYYYIPAMLGTVYLQRGDFLKGKNQVDEAYRLAPNLALPLFLQGILHVLMQQPEKAESFFSQSMAKNPLFPEVHFGYGLLRMQQHKWKEAQGYFERAIKLKPSFIDAHYQLGLSYREQGQIAQARSIWEKALMFAPHHPQVTQALKSISVHK